MNDTILKPGLEPIEGYVLSERLGAGGYGEVWKCDAPGGLMKAIKFIFGQAGGTQSARELKSLRRVSNVYHPFLLSIERIETVREQTLIITELAESSLEDRLQACLRAGGTGIPRNELLKYFRDAADALDFLADEHSLQHLDVKPGNLLIVARRIKVGDFGLLKDLNDVEVSSVAGMTPAYSAPEVFDGRPDARSDQYSLAVAYVELLSGKLPFDGQTMAELAKQHLSASPNLDALPPADREVVARALLKDPFDRYANCRQFIDQLIKVKHSRLPQSLADTTVESPERRSTNPMTEVSGSAPVVLRPKQSCPTEVGKDTPITRCLFVGLGGIGSRAVASLKYRVAPILANPDSLVEARWLAIDTDRIDFSTRSDDSLRAESELGEDEKLELRLQTPDVYRRGQAGKYNALSRRWLYNIPRSRTTEGIRPLGVLAMVHSLEQIRRLLTAKIRPIVEAEDFDASRSVIYVMSSLHGGSGSAMLPEIGLLIRDIVSSLCVGEFEGRQPSIQALATIGEVTRCGPARMGPAAAIASLSELLYHMSPQRAVPPLESNRGRSRSRPFDWVGLVQGGSLSDASESQRAADRLSSVAFVDAMSPASRTLKNVRADNPDDHWLRTFNVAPMQITEHLPQEQFSQFATAQALGGLLRWVEQDGSSPGDAQVAEFAEKQLEILSTHSDDESPLFAMQELWNERLSPHVEIREKRLSADVACWDAAVRSPLSAQQLSWPQSLRLGQAALSRLSAYITDCREQLQAELVVLFENSPQVPKFARLDLYLADLLRAVNESADQLELHRASIAETTKTALKTISEAIPAQVGRQIAAQVSHSHAARGLLSSITNAAVKRLTAELPLRGSVPDIDVAQLLEIMKSLAIKAASETEVVLVNSRDDAIEAANRFANVLESQLPRLTSNGGDVLRLVIGPAHKLNELRRILPLATDRDDILDQTTLVHTLDATDEPVVVSEGCNLPIGLIVQSLFRPNGNLFTLAEKLRTRVDIDWPHIEHVLEEDGRSMAPLPCASDRPEEAAAASPFSQAPVTAPTPSSSPFSAPPISESCKTQHL